MKKETNGVEAPWTLSSLVPSGRRPVVLVRHAQTAWNREGRFLGRTDIPLDETGHAQAARLAGLLPQKLGGLPATGPVRICSSPLARARQTAAPLARALGHAVELHEDLVELDHGELEGRMLTELLQTHRDFFRAWRKDPSEVPIPGGETLQACQARMRRALHSLHQETAPGVPLVLVGHKMALLTLLCEVLELPLRCYGLIGLENASLTVLSMGEDGPRLHRLNDAL